MRRISFTSLSSPTIILHSASTVLSGTVNDGKHVPAGDTVKITLNGVRQTATVQSDGTFSSSFGTSALYVGAYEVDYAFAKQGQYLAAKSTSTLNVTYNVVLVPVPYANVLSTNGTPTRQGKDIVFQIALTDANNQFLAITDTRDFHFSYSTAANPGTLLSPPAGSGISGRPSNYVVTYSLNAAKLKSGKFDLDLAIDGDPVTHPIAFTV